MVIIPIKEFERSYTVYNKLYDEHIPPSSGYAAYTWTVRVNVEKMKNTENKLNIFLKYAENNSIFAVNKE